MTSADDILLAIKPYFDINNAVSQVMVTSENRDGTIYVYKVPNTVPPVLICQTSGAIDCDGQETVCPPGTTDCVKNDCCCNSQNDFDFQNDTSFHQSDGKPLNAATLPFYVLPEKGSKWFDYSNFNISGGQLGLIIYKPSLNQNAVMNFGIFGDEDGGHLDEIGEISYAMAKSLGIDPNPNTGGVNEGVTFIIFTSPENVINPIEDHDLATTTGNNTLNLLMSQISQTPQTITATLTITPQSINLGDSITLDVKASGGTPPYSYQWAGFPTPTSSNIIQGCVPNQVGNLTTNVTVTDSSSPPNSIIATGTVNVTPPTPPPTPGELKVSLEINPKKIKIDHKTSIKTKVSGGTKPYSYNYLGLPSPCKSSDKDHIECKPGKEGDYTISVNVTDSKGKNGTDSHTLTVHK